MYFLCFIMIRQCLTLKGDHTHELAEGRITAITPIQGGSLSSYRGCRVSNHAHTLVSEGAKRQLYSIRHQYYNQVKPLLLTLPCT